MEGGKTCDLHGTYWMAELLLLLLELLLLLLLALLLPLFITDVFLEHPTRPCHLSKGVLTYVLWTCN